MSRRDLTLVTALSACVLLGAVAAGQQPRISNGQVTARSASSGLAQTFRTLVAAQSEIAWIAYAVPVKDRERMMCCWTSADGSTFFSGTMRAGDGPCCGSCRIEPSSGGTAPRPAAGVASPPAGSQGPIKLEGSDRMVVLFRVVDRQVERIRSYSEDCALDAGGRAVHWLEGVAPAESIALLESLVGVERDRKNRVTSAALQAISVHSEPSAAPTIERLARSHPAPAVRGDALFWLAQLAGQKVAGTITDAIDNDPDTEVKRRAVFALSQLPKDEGVPLLIQVARKNTNAAVRKQAIFWLGQSKDPRALDFFAEILK
ncbi:MAG TPA: HEAT repeat domain-containing protein [Vicinamibacterales bacterium]|nr:HEAT repeat domain-containing protein [Vicinamibacterales bacterium]